MGRSMLAFALTCLVCTALSWTAGCAAETEEDEKTGAATVAVRRGPYVPRPSPGVLGWDLMSTEDRVGHLKKLVDKLEARATTAEQRVDALERELNAETLKNDTREENLRRAIMAAGGRNSPECTGNRWLTLAQLGIKIAGVDTSKLVISTGSCP